MTRAERLAQQAQYHAEQLRALRAKQQQEVRRRTEARRRQVGRMVEESGLFVLEDDVLRGLFQVLATLAALPNPVVVLAGLLSQEGRRGLHGQDLDARAAPVHGATRLTHLEEGVDGRAIPTRS